MELKELETTVGLMDTKIDGVVVVTNEIKDCLLGTYKEKGMLAEHRDLVKIHKEERRLKKDWFKWFERLGMAIIIGLLIAYIQGLLT